jgi:PAS domain-containing protein
MANARIEKARAGGPQTLEWHCKSKDDLLFWAEISIRYVEVEHSTAVVAIVRDTSERRPAEESLRVSEERFRLLVEEAPDAILLFDYDQARFITASKAAERLFGGSAQPNPRPRTAALLDAGTTRRPTSGAVLFGAQRPRLGGRGDHL